MLYSQKAVFISVIKHPKLGCNGLMFELTRLICTHNDDDTYIPPENVYILTGMSNNNKWVYNIKNDSPSILEVFIFFSSFTI